MSPTAATTVTATELARILSDILNRTQHRGERFIVERHGERVATIGPGLSNSAPTLADLATVMRSIPWPDDNFADDLEEIKRSQLPAEFPEWSTS